MKEGAAPCSLQAKLAPRRQASAAGSAREMLYDPPWRFAMSDVILVCVTVGFFALAWAYVLGCERI